MSARTFSFLYGTDLSPSENTFKEYLITVTGVSGDDVQVSDQDSFVLRVNNPCLDNDYVSIVPPTIPA
jgi:hypothetical protein